MPIHGCECFSVECVGELGAQCGGRAGLDGWVIGGSCGF